MGYDGYGDYLRSRHWHTLKQRYRESDLPQECICGETTVQLHHMSYERIGDERLTDLTPLCNRCHSLIHVLEFRGQTTLDFVGLFDAGRAQDGRAMLLGLAEQQERERRAHLQAQQQHVLSLSFAQRLNRARDHARFRRHVNITHQLRILKRQVEEGRSDLALTRSLRIIEEKAYGWEGWREVA